MVSSHQEATDEILVIQIVIEVLFIDFELIDCILGYLTLKQIVHLEILREQLARKNDGLVQYSRIKFLFLKVFPEL